MKRIPAIITFILLLISAVSQTFAQTYGGRIVSGRVLDDFNEPLPGAAVYVRGHMKDGTSTDSNGYFSLELPQIKHVVLEASFLGMKPCTVEYAGQKEILMVMQADANMMESAIVMGKTNINDLDIRAKAGVVNAVDMDRLQDRPVMDLSLSLQGSAPGLIVTNRGDLGTKPEIRIRGNSSFRKGDVANEPLYVLDGQVISSDAFMTLNPLDIAEIKILKDAVACALYGTKAANGVLEITSVRGTNGDTMVTYDFNGGVTFRGRRGVQMMDTDEKLELERRLRQPNTPGYIYSEEYIRKENRNAPNIDELIAEGRAMLDNLRKTNTDWF